MTFLYIFMLKIGQKNLVLKISGNFEIFCILVIDIYIHMIFQR